MLFGSSGIRQPFSTSLLETAMKVGMVLGNEYEEILIGADTQKSSEAIAHAIISGAIASGSRIFSTGIVPTPVVAYGAKHHNIIGVMSTASHNGGSYGGVKLFNPDSSAFTKKQQYHIEHMVNNQIKVNPQCGDFNVVWDKDTYIDHITRDFYTTDFPFVNPLIDASTGTGKLVTPELLPNAFVVNRDRPSEPNEVNTYDIPQIMMRESRNLAILHDEDADRMMAYDDNYEYISGDNLLMLFMMYMDVQHMVTTYDASMALNEIATVERTPVGDSYVSDVVKSWGEFGGEPSGAMIFPEHSLCPDGPYAALKLCEIANEWNIHEVIDGFPKYTMIRESFFCTNADKILNNMGVDIPTDGYYDLNSFGWFLIRASGTEPKLRITVEGYTKENAKHLMEAARYKIRQNK
jgi:phosphoglucosamine mutase